MIKTIEALISVKFIHRGDKIFQHFIVDKKKGVLKYLIDSRYVVYDKFQQKIITLALSNNPNYHFVEKRFEEDRVVLEFKILDITKYKKMKNYYFVIPGFVPDSPGCEHCLFKKKDHCESFFYCDKREKMLAHKMKKCQFFRQDPDLFKT